VIERAYIHVAGPERSGKTTLVEAILGAFGEPTITVCCRRNDNLAESVEAAPARDAELRRYRAAGAQGAARLESPAAEEDGDAFFYSRVISDYSTAVLIEGDCPVGYLDLDIFVAPPLPTGRALLWSTKRRLRAAGASALDTVVLTVGRRPAIAAFAKSRAREAVGKAGTADLSRPGASGARRCQRA
jgi:hypothetical protein